MPLPIEVPKITVDDYSELLEDSLTWLEYVSEGNIDTASRISVARYLMGAVVYAGSVLLYETNRLVESTAFYFLGRIAGVERYESLPSRTTLQFQLDAPQTTPFYVSQGFRVYTANNELSFITTEDLTIPSGSVIGEVIAESEEGGTRYNVASGVVNRPETPRANLAAVYNIDPATGGRDAESEDEAIERGSTELRRRGTLISSVDYQERTEELIGPGAAVRVIPWHVAGGSGIQGEIGIYALQNKRALTGTQIADLQRIIVSETFQSLPINLNSAEIEYADIYISLGPLLSVGTIPVDLYNMIEARFNPPANPIGESLNLNRLISEIADVVGDGGSIIQVLINNKAYSVQPANQKTALVIRDVTVDVTLDTGEVIPHQFTDPLILPTGQV